MLLMQILARIMALPWDSDIGIDVFDFRMILMDEWRKLSRDCFSGTSSIAIFFLIRESAPVIREYALDKPRPLLV